MAPSLRAIARALALAAIAAGCGAGNDITRAPAQDATRTAGASAAPPPLESGRLPGTARPLRYALSLVVDPAKERFLGDVTIDVDVPAATPAIVLHGRDLSVIRAEATVAGRPVSARAEGRAAAGGKGSPEELVLTFTRPIPAGKAQLRVSYSAPLDGKLSGLYRVEEGGAHYAFTQLEPMDARRMFPCFDEPGFKVPFDLKVTAPRGNLVVANANEIDRTDADDGRSVTFTFATTPPLPTYLLALAVGPFEVREGASAPVKIRIVTARGKAKLGELALEAAAAHVKILGEYFDRPYPYPKLDLLAVPEFGFGAMENAGLITFREDLVLLDAQSASVAARRSMAENVAHEIAHHWFGNLVTMEWWDDLWLNEGFATWMETRVVDAWRPEMNARLEALGDKGWVMGLDALDSARAVRQPIRSNSEAEEAFDGLTYEKGASVIEMIERWLGPDVFRDGVRAYMKAHEHGNAKAADLFAALSKASGKDVGAVASTFLDQPGVPLVRASLACEAGGKGSAAAAARVKLSQARFRVRPGGDPAAATWRIPLCVSYEGGEKAGPACGVLDGAEGEIPLPGGRCPRWIYPNAEDSGYFRFALPPAELAALSGAGKDLDARSRIGLLDNAWALVQSGDLGSDALLDLIAGMRRERQRLVVAQMIAALARVSDALVGADARPAFQAYASSILLPIAKELGWDARRTDGDEQRLMRTAVLAALSVLAEDPWLHAEADRRAAAFLKEPRSVSGEIAAIALGASTRRAGEARLGELTEALARTAPPPTPEDRRAILAAMGSFADAALLRRALDWTLTERVRLQDAYALYDSAAEWPASRPVLIAWIRANLSGLTDKLPDFAIVRLAEVLGTICDGAERAEAAAFFGEELRDVEGADRPFMQALETADNCIDLRAREGARLRRRLGGAARKAGK